MRNSRETRPEYPPKPLEPYYLGKSVNKEKEVETVKPISIENDTDRQERREALLEQVEKRFSEKSLFDRLNGEINSPSEVLRQGMLGFLPDDTLISDIAPQGKGKIKSDKLNMDPLWAEVSVNLNYQDIFLVVTMFDALGKISNMLEDRKISESVKSKLGQDSLLTLKDLRSISSPKVWEKMPGFGEKGAKIICDATRKIEE